MGSFVESSLVVNGILEFLAAPSPLSERGDAHKVARKRGVLVKLAARTKFEL